LVLANQCICMPQSLAHGNGWTHVAVRSGPSRRLGVAGFLKNNPGNLHEFFTYASGPCIRLIFARKEIEDHLIKVMGAMLLRPYWWSINRIV